MKAKDIINLSTRLTGLHYTLIMCEVGETILRLFMATAKTLNPKQGLKSELLHSNIG